MIIIDLHPQSSLDKKCTEVSVGRDGEIHVDSKAGMFERNGLTSLKVLHTGRTVTSEAQYNKCLILWTRDKLQEKGAYQFDEHGDPIFIAEKLLESSRLG